MKSRYLIVFGIDVISKQNVISRKHGNCVVTTDATLADVKRKENRGVLLSVIWNDVQPKLKQKILNIEISKISQIADKEIKSDRVRIVRGRRKAPTEGKFETKIKNNSKNKKKQ